jgi:two-component system, OmpR family, sensor histidine kinase BaeS
MSRRFVRRAVRFVVILVVLLAVLIVGLAWLLTALFDQAIVSAIVPAIALLIGLLIVMRLLRGVRRAAAPLGDLIEASGRLEAGEAGAQVEVRGPREIRALVQAFNSMSARLAADTEERRRLLADVSHELRTPLTVIQGNVEGMLDGLYPPDRPHLERVLVEARQLERLVEDLRTLSLADAGALPLHREPTDLGVLAADVVAGFEPQAAEGGVDLSVEAEPVVSQSLDPRRMRQVIGNLLSNALRHTPRGGSVTVTVRSAIDAVELVVADTGSGMDASVATRAFDRFSRSGEHAGAGLGLAIVRDLVRAHGGDVSLESVAGTGTTVRFRLPLASASPEERS